MERLIRIFKRAFRKTMLYGDFLIVFVLVEFNIKKSIRIKSAKEPILLRSRTSDIRVFRQIFIDKEYDINKIGKMLPLNFDPKVIIDGGGNIGLAAVYFKNRYKDAKIISIEPDKENFEILKQNISHYDNVIGINTAIWNKETFLKIENTNSSKWGFTVHEADESEKDSFIATDIAALMVKYKIDYIDILKIDIEGAEKEVFSANNCDEWLIKTHILVIEVHDFMREGTAKAVFNAVQKYDYTFSNIGENLVFVFNHKPQV